MHLAAKKKKPIQSLFFSVLLLCAWIVPLMGQSAQAIEPGAQLIKERKFNEAKIFFQDYVSQHPGDAQGHLYLGQALFQEKKYEEALVCFAKAAELDKSSAPALTWQGHAYGLMAQKAGLFKAPGLAKKCRKSYEEAVARAPGDIPARSALMEYLLNAPGIIGGSVKKALLQAEAIKRINALDGHRAFVRCYEYDEEYEDAEKECLAGLALAADDVSLNRALGGIWLADEQYDKALAYFDARFKRDAQDLYSCYQVGRIAALSEKNLERGITCLTHYLTQELTSPDLTGKENAHWRLGQIYGLKGDKQKAQAEFEAALKIDPKHEEARKALKKIRD